MARLASITKSYVVIDRALFEELMTRKGRVERLSIELRDRLEDEHGLLMLALHQLARERGVSDRAHFARQWLRKTRSQERSIPVAPEGGRSERA